MMCTAQRCNENTPEAFAFRGVFLCYRSVLHAPQRTSFLRSKTSLRQHIMPKAHHAEGHHLRSNIIYFTWLGCGCGGILVNSAFSTSGVATLDTTISRMTAVK